MESYKDCPVPIQQRPLEEFRELSNGWFFPLAQKAGLDLYLFISWLFLLPLIYFIALESIKTSQDLPYLITSSLVISLTPPLLIICRLLLGWSYINNRLLSNIIEYEESGWQDGQSWEKPLYWKAQEVLISQHEVQPVILRLQKKLVLIVAIIVFGAYLSKTI